MILLPNQPCGQLGAWLRSFLDDPALVFLAKRAPATVTCRWGNRPRHQLSIHMIKSMTSDVTKPMTKPAARR